MNKKIILFMVLGLVFWGGSLSMGIASPQPPGVTINLNAVHHNAYFVSVKGKNTNLGSRRSPWDLQTALSQPAVIKPGDILVIEGGTYAGHFTSNLTGTKARPIIVKAMFKSRVIIKSSDTSNTASLVIKGSWTIYKDLVIKGTVPQSLLNTSSGNRFIHVTVINPQSNGGVLNIKGQVKTISDRGGLNKTLLGNVVSGS